MAWKEVSHLTRALIATIFSVLWAIVLVLVGGRFLALLAGANRDSELVDGLYRYSEFWVKPFFNMFGLANEAVKGGGTFEPASLIAFVVYLVVGILILGVLSGAMATRFGHGHA